MKKRSTSTRTSAALAGLCVVLAASGCVQEFDLSVAAFEAHPGGAILWTHVVPADPSRPAPLGLEIATDAGFADVVQRHATIARPRDDFTARVAVDGLAPDTRYYYRFRALASLAAELVSPTGSFRTAPAAGAAAPVRFVLSGDSNLGFVTRHTDSEGAPLPLDFYVLSAAAAEDPDFFVFFGDTIYADSGVLPGGADAESLDDYREVHRLTRADPHMQALLAATGTFAGWDDHEVTNDYDGETVDPDQFAAGARAFFEYLPLREQPGRAPFLTYRRVRWGRDLELFFVDGRQYRSAERFCNETLPDGPETGETLFSPFEEDEVIVEDLLGPGDLFDAASAILLPSDPDCVADLLEDPERSYLGPEQLAWLEQALLDSDATWKVIVNDTPISTLFFLPYDRWEGYLAERQALLDFIAQNLDPDHTLVLTTDFHDNLAIRRPEFTELLVGPIGQSTFGLGVADMLPPDLGIDAGIVLDLLDAAIGQANGPGSFLASEHDAFSYARIEIFEQEGESRLRATVRGHRRWANGANDPSRVRDLFCFELPGGTPCP